MFLHIIFMALTVMYLWPYASITFNLVPEVLRHFLLLPSLAVMAYFLPTPVLTVSGTCGIVFIVINNVSLTKPRKAKRVSHIPPPPKR